MAWRRCSDSGCCRLYEGKETAEFQRSLQQFFLSLNRLMKSPLEGPTLLSQVWRGGMVLCEGSALACGGMDGAPAGVLAVAVPGEHQPSCVQTSLCTGCQKELPPCVVPQCPQGPPLLPLMQSPRPEAPDHKTPLCAGAWGCSMSLGQQLCVTGQTLSRPYMC